MSAELVTELLNRPRQTPAVPASADPAAPDPASPDGSGSPGAEVGALPRSARLGRLWRGAWPKMLAAGLLLGSWQAVALSGWKPGYVLPGPSVVLVELARMARTAVFWQAIATTLTRAVIGFAIAVTVGSVLGIAVSRSRILRAGVGSLITGLQTMPSITWFPLAILLFGVGSEQAIMFVVVLGAAPSVANGIISGIDHVPPAFVRLGTVLGARGAALYRFVVVPAALPSYVGGLNQGWAFAWRSLMAGELLVTVQGRPSVGSRLAFAQDFGMAADLLGYMLVILVFGMLADSLFSTWSRRLRARRGLLAD